MIHRGVQYSRAIRRYVKKTGRYPSRLEELENTNNIRFLRKRYTDPVTGKDFKLLHVGEVQLSSPAGIAGASPIGNNPASQAGSCSPAGSGRRHDGRSRPPARYQPERDFGRGRGRRSGCELGQPVVIGTSRRRTNPSPTIAQLTGESERPVVEHSFRRRTDRWCCQHQQSPKHSRVQSQEPLQPVAVHLRSHHGSRRPHYHACATCVAVSSPVATAEFVEAPTLQDNRILRRNAEHAPSPVAHPTTSVVRNRGTLFRPVGAWRRSYPKAYGLGFILAPLRGFPFTGGFEERKKAERCGIRF